MTGRSGLVVSLCGLLACSGPSDAELRGDQALGANRMEEALQQYRAAAEERSRARVWAKLGAAALRVGQPAEAVQAFAELGREDASREEEAADGLEQAARAAIRARDAVSLRAALRALVRLAPGRPHGQLVLELARLDQLRGDEATVLLPYALAATGSGRSADSLLAAWGAALRDSDGCAAALPVLRAARRRGAPGRMLSAARGCAVALGDSVLAKDAAIAEAWYTEALAADSTARDAWFGLARARLALGDTTGALQALDAARRGETTDSIAGAAADLQRLIEQARQTGSPLQGER